MKNLIKNIKTLACRNVPLLVYSPHTVAVVAVFKVKDLH